MRVAFLISGAGSTMEAIVHATKGSRLADVTPALVIASHPEITGIERAKKVGIPENNIKVIVRKDFETQEAFGEAIIEECRIHNIDFIGQYGWMMLTPTNVIEAYQGRIVNQHPGPLDAGRPDFGGKGMFGLRVHAARLGFVQETRHDFWTEATAHRVTEHFDEGGVLKAARVPILDTDTPETLQMRVLPVEHDVQIDTIKDFRDNMVHEIIRPEPLIRPEEISILEAVKAQAILRYPNG
jgi:folate-dependent phosphoribosylglycinamide formyltransferase PurN